MNLLPVQKQPSEVFYKKIHKVHRKTRVLESLRTTQKHNYQLKLNIPKSGVRGAQTNFFYYRTMKACNVLLKIVRHASNLNIFKTKLDGACKDLF